MIDRVSNTPLTPIQWQIRILLILAPRSISIPPENVTKPLAF